MLSRTLLLLAALAVTAVPRIILIATTAAAAASHSHQHHRASLGRCRSPAVEARRRGATGSSATALTSRYAASGSWLEGFGRDDRSSDRGATTPDDKPSERQQQQNERILSSLQREPLLQIPVAVRLDHVEQQKASTKRSSSTKQEPSTWTPVQVYLDTGAQRTVMSYEYAQQLGLLQHLDRRYGDANGDGTMAYGIGSSRLVGRLPAGLLWMNVHNQVRLPSPAILVLAPSSATTLGDSNVVFLLGLDFLRDHGAVIDLRQEQVTLTVRGEQQHDIPFIRPRRSMNGDAVTQSDSCRRIKDRQNWADNDDDDDFDSSGIDMSGV